LCPADPSVKAKFQVYLCASWGHSGTQKAEVLNSLIMKIMVSENDTNDILQTFR